MPGQTARCRSLYSSKRSGRTCNKKQTRSMVSSRRLRRRAEILLKAMTFGVPAVGGGRFEALDWEGTIDDTTGLRERTHSSNGQHLHSDVAERRGLGRAGDYSSPRRPR